MLVKKIMYRWWNTSWLKIRRLPLRKINIRSILKIWLPLPKSWACFPRPHPDSGSGQMYIYIRLMFFHFLVSLFFLFWLYESLTLCRFKQTLLFIQVVDMRKIIVLIMINGLKVVIKLVYDIRCNCAKFLAGRACRNQYRTCPSTRPSVVLPHAWGTPLRQE